MKSTENVLENIPTRQLEQKCKDKLRNYKFYNIRNKQTNKQQQQQQQLLNSIDNMCQPSKCKKDKQPNQGEIVRVESSCVGSPSSVQ